MFALVASPQSTKCEELGAVLGAGCGFLFDSAIYVWLGAGIIWLVFASFGLILIVPVWFGIRVGVKAAQKGMLPTASWIVIAAVAIVTWPAAIYIPVGVRTAHLHLLAVREIPTFPGADKIYHSLIPIADEEIGPSITYVFRVEANEKEVVTFYRDELVRRGWKERPLSSNWFQKQAWIGATKQMAIKFGTRHSEKIRQFAVTLYMY